MNWRTVHMFMLRTTAPVWANGNRFGCCSGDSMEALRKRALNEIFRRIKIPDLPNKFHRVSPIQRLRVVRAALQDHVWVCEQYQGLDSSRREIVYRREGNVASVTVPDEMNLSPAIHSFYRL